MLLHQVKDPKQSPTLVLPKNSRDVEITSRTKKDAVDFRINKVVLH